MDAVDHTPCTSLSAGAALRAILMSEPAIAGTVTQIFPVYTDAAALPYISYRRTELEAVPTKSGRISADTVSMEVVIYTAGYAEGVRLAELVRQALDGISYQPDVEALEDGPRLKSCRLAGSGEETYEGDAYIQPLLFSIKM